MPLLSIRHRLRTVASLGLVLAACTTGGEQGVLVGLTSGRTLWIAWPNDSARVVTEKPHLLVPREDGMWWAGVVTRCTISEGSGWVEDTIFVESEAAVFTTRAGEEARVTLEGRDCDATEQEVFERRTRARKDTVDQERLYPETFYCSVDSRRITFASPTVLSVERRSSSTEFCNPAKYSTWGSNVVTEFGSQNRIALRPLLSKEASARLEQLFANSDFPDENPGGRFDSTWAIRRQQGAWVAQRWVDGSIAARGGYETEDGEPLPHTLTGDSPLPVEWAELVRQLSNARDAAASPSGKHMLIQQADWLLILRVDGRELGPVMLSIHTGYEGELAMVRWATPDETRRWNAMLPALQTPRVTVVPPQP